MQLTDLCALVGVCLIGILAAGVVMLGCLVGEMKVVRHELSWIDIRLKNIYAELRAYRIDLDRCDRVLADLMLEVCKPLRHDSLCGELHDDLLADVMEDLPDWPVEDTRKEDESDEC